ncbi:MAG: serine/threonine-protein kinase [Acidobacteriia bacterium]|nr:serine/threonine-protein kinase [Terriglobia bacterium]
MTIAAGTKLGPYEILAPIGAGGMGEVYRARDAKLGRDVALKVLPERFARDTERMARFGREAKVLASLNHPNIATIHGLEDSGQTHALVMELVEGPTLADRIRSGPIPIGEALRIAKQMCEALEYAHEHGIVHRDLKPANVKVTADDAVKILDFGLAKAFEGDASSIDIANSPTISRMATQAGVLLGTAAYMSPEQAKGKAVDRRADIWGFGCVLYEMLTGKMAFQGETVTDTLAAVIKEEPDWKQLPAGTPNHVRVLLQRCLQKDPRQRLRDIGDARISLEEVLSGAQDQTSVPSTARSTSPWRLWVVSGIAGVLLVATVLLTFLYFHQKPAASQAVRFEIPVPDKFTLNGDLALSPDGRQLAFIGTGADGQSRLWVRPVEAIEARPLEGTEGAAGWPIWAPDSRFIAFAAQGKLKKVESGGGPPVTLCDAASVLGGAWSREDKIVYGSFAGLFQVSAAGGSPSPLSTGGASVAPSFLPDGRHFLYAGAGSQSGGPGIYLGSVDTKEQPWKKLLADASAAVYAQSSDPAVGYMLFVRGAPVIGGPGMLMAQPFDTRRMELTGEAVPIAEQISGLSFSASATDALVYVRGPQTGIATGVRGIIQGQLTWFDREGKALGAIGDPGLYRTLALSPDGKHVAFDRGDPQGASTRNMWLYEFARGVTTRFTFDSGWDPYPVWSPDGSRIAFGSNRGGGFDLYQKTSNLAGEDELLYKSGDAKVPTSWSPDGRFLLYFNPVPPSHLWVLPLGGGDRKPILVERSEFNEAVGRFSPDGRWIAYSSDESGKTEIYVRPFDAASATGASPEGATAVTGKWMVSKDGGTNPLWRRDSKELFYMSAAGGAAMAVDVSTSGVFQAGVPKVMFHVPAGVLFWDVSADGKRFLMAAPSATSPAAPPKFTVTLNWQSALKK